MNVILWNEVHYCNLTYLLLVGVSYKNPNKAVGNFFIYLQINLHKNTKFQSVFLNAKVRVPLPYKTYFSKYQFTE